MDQLGLEIRLEGFEPKEWEKLEVRFPLYVQCYEEALTAILNNIESNSKALEERRNSKIDCGSTKSEFVRPLKESNIIAFMGDRGAGKTTAVNEFCRLLRGYFRDYEEWNSKLVCRNRGDNKEYKFHVLTPIDASVLGTKEDLVEVILAGLYQEFQREYELCKQASKKSVLIQEIIRNFDDAYKEYVNVGKRDEQIGIQETALARLKYISNSLKAKATLKTLICNFLKLLDNEKDSEKSYLVVTIDDLDMSPENGYEMLEQLYKYFSNQKVIILIAIKYEQMKTICDKHFADCLTPEHGGIHKNIFTKSYKRAKKLSNDYLLKVIPLSNRVYMPEANVLDKRCFVVIPEDEKTVKEFILSKIALKMNIFYDIRGVKKHFCLPGTIRELVTYNEFLDSLIPFEEIEKAQDKKIILYDQNHERFNADIEFGMATRVLDDEQLELFRLIKARDIERRAKYTVNFLKSWMGGEKGSRLKDEVDRQKYCYADLLQSIYKLGREDYDDKPLVHCILASFTSEMVREYYSYRNNPKPEARNRAAQRLKGFLGESFGGLWFDADIAKEKINYEKETIQLSSMPHISWVKREIRISFLLKENEDKMSRAVKELKELVLYIECLMMLFFKFRDGSGREILPKWEFDISDGATVEGEKIEIVISNDAEDSVFDILGFIGKEITIKSDNEKEVLDKQVDMLIEDAKRGVEKYTAGSDFKRIGDKNRFYDDLKVWIEKHSIWYKIKAKDQVSFPYYNLDMSYNIMKRVKASLEKNMQTETKSEDAYNYLKTVYGYIADELGREDEKYEKLVGDDKAPKVRQAFLESPFVNALSIQCEKNQEDVLDSRMLSNVFCQAFKIIDPITVDVIAQHDMDE